MLASKDYVIKVFKEEISRKNILVNKLLARQEELENKLTKMEEILSYDQRKLNQNNAIK